MKFFFPSTALRHQVSMTSLVLLPCHVKPLFINVHEAVDTKGMFGWASAPPKTTPAPAPRGGFSGGAEVILENIWKNRSILFFIN